MAAYGIDLGTTYSCIARIDDTGRAVVLKNAVGWETTPSVVYFESPTSVTVGQVAKNSASMAPGAVVSLVKRHMGDAEMRWKFHGVSHTPESISACILRELARAAADHDGEPVHEVVITVPAYFGIAEREATRRAGQIAGLEVLDVIQEPVAAALHYQALRNAGGSRHLLVYDLGGGTFDTTVIHLSGDDVKVICTDGDHQLGGADWDASITRFMLERFTAEHPGIDPRADEQGMELLATAVETAKMELSLAQSRRITMIFGGKASSIELTRSKLEELTRIPLERTMTIIERTIAAAQEKGVTSFDDVLLVGGMTRMPIIAATLRERFGLAPSMHEPDLAVAKGAAIFATIRQVKVRMSYDDSPGEAHQDKVIEIGAELNITPAQVERFNGITVASVVPRAFGLMVIDDTDPLYLTDKENARRRIVHLLAANTLLPADAGPKVFRTAFDDQPVVDLQVWEQAGSEASEELPHNVQIGKGILAGLPLQKAGRPFEVTFHMTAMGLLKVHAEDKESGQEVRFEIQIGLTDAQARASRETVARYDITS
jgi:molecular chaperone DnaK